MRIRSVAARTAAVCGLVLTTAASVAPATWAADQVTPDHRLDKRHIPLSIPSPALAQCMPRADVSVDVTSNTDQRGFDTFEMTARHVAPDRDYTIFLMQNASFPFGPVEYIGELHANHEGDGRVDLHLIVDEAFTLLSVDGHLQHVDMTQIGVWFADPKDDDFCLGPNSPGSPFDGDGEAGALAFNSATPAPVPVPPTTRPV